MDAQNWQLCCDALVDAETKLRLVGRLVGLEEPEVKEELYTCALILDRCREALRCHVTPVGNAGRTELTTGSAVALPKEKPHS